MTCLLIRSVSEEGASILVPDCDGRSNVCSLQIHPMPAAARWPAWTHSWCGLLIGSWDSVSVSGDSFYTHEPASSQVNHACRLPPHRGASAPTQGRVRPSPHTHTQQLSATHWNKHTRWKITGLDPLCVCVAPLAVMLSPGPVWADHVVWRGATAGTGFIPATPRPKTAVATI